MANIPSLPLEMVTRIMDCFIYKNIQHYHLARGVNRYFKERYTVALLPRIYICNLDLARFRRTLGGEILVSVAEIRRVYGDHSGLLESIKTIVNDISCGRCYLWLLPEKHSWYRVLRIVRKDK